MHLPTGLQLLEAEKARVRKEFERREAAVEVRKKVGSCCWAVGCRQGLGRRLHMCAVGEAAVKVRKTAG